MVINFLVLAVLMCMWMFGIVGLVIYSLVLFYLMKKYYDRISFVHLKDLDENGFAPLGTGHVDVEGVLRFLKEKGYAGDYLVEADGFAGDPEEACRTSYRFLQGKLI